MPHRMILPVLALASLPLAARAEPAAAQWPPDSLVNLEVLPEDISVRELVGIMRGFAGGLGVRCTHCHVGDDPSDLASIDFVSDEKIEKRKAREMIRMVRRINDELLAEIPERSDPPVEVRCATCHHAVTRPVDIRDILVETATAEGADAAIARYQELREEYYGSYSYDFRPFMLANVGERLGRGHPDAAIAILEFNAGLYPDLGQTYMTMAQIYASQRNMEAAERAVERAIEAEPDNAFYQRALQRLRGRQDRR